MQLFYWPLVLVVDTDDDERSRSFCTLLILGVEEWRGGNVNDERDCSKNIK